MSLTYKDLHSVSRSIAAKVYLQWLDKHDVLESFSRPESIPSFFYTKRWVPDHHHILEKIFKFLGTFELLTEASGTWIKTENYDHIINNQLDRIVLTEYSSHPTYKFIKYGLRIYEDQLEGDSSVWDLNQYNFIFERGITQPSYQLLCHLIDDIIDDELLTNLNKDLHVSIIGHYQECYITALHNHVPNISMYSIVAPNEEFKEGAITYCELKSETAKFSNRIFTEEEFVRNMERPIDLVLLSNGFGFYKSLKELLAYLNSVTRSGSIIYIFAPTDPAIQIGIEPLFYMHPHYHGIPDDHDIKRQFKASGFDEPKRTGPFNLIFEVKKH
ncbi:MAG: hypothetical protein ACXAB7_11730 [Candidatus Kariarchaeaceae archaeon]|jgi:hypothetical protein